MRSQSSVSQAISFLRRLGKQTLRTQSQDLKRKRRLVVEGLEDRRLMAIRMWDGDAVSNNLSNAKNWVGDIAPVAGDSLVFPADASSKTVDFDYADNTFFQSISLGGGFTLKGNRIAIGTGGIEDNSSKSDIIKNGLELGASAALMRPFNVGPGSTLFVDGEIRGGGGVSKLGTGNLSFRANNSYGGLTDIAEGTLFAEKDSSLGGTTIGTQIRPGATLLLNDTSIGILRISEPITASEGATIRAIDDVTYDGKLTLNGQVTLKHDTDQVLAKFRADGFITGPGGITIPAGSKVTMSGQGGNTFLGETIVLGELTLNSVAPSISNTTVESSGVVDMKAQNQINGGAILTINGHGEFHQNEYDVVLQKLIMNGGIFTGGAPEVFRDILKFLIFNADIIPSLQVTDKIQATSAADGTPAIIAIANLKKGNQIIQVDDGPNSIDLKLDADFEGNITKTGKGTTNLLSIAEGIMAFAIHEGTVEVESDIPEVQFQVFGGGTLKSSATIGPTTIHNGGKLSPGIGNQITKLNVEGDLTLEPGGILEVLLDGTVAGSTFDQVSVNGKVILNNAILQATFGPSAVIGQQYTVVLNDGTDAIVGKFAAPTSSAPFFLASPSNERLSANYTSGSAANDLTLKFENTPPKAPDLHLDQVTVNEGEFVVARGSLVDPDRNTRLRLNVDWGDGTHPEVFQPGVNPFAIQHRYVRSGKYTAKFSWLDEFNQGNSRQFSILVDNFPPKITITDTRNLSNQRIVVVGNVSDPGLDKFTLRVDFGDDTPPQTVSVRQTSFVLTHKYSKPGRYVVKLTATDDQGAVTNLYRLLSVS